MTTSLIQEITQQLKIHRSLKTYFDSGSNEFNQTDYDEKIRTLSKIVSAGYDINTIIKKYEPKYNSNSNRHFYNSIIQTIKGYISYINSGIIYDPKILKPLENATDSEVIQHFTDTIKEKILSDYTIEKLILSYVDFKFNYIAESYMSLSKFFDIDFDADNDQQLLKRTKKEKLDENQWSYGALNHYLKRILFNNFYNNRISDLNPILDMPMSKGIIFFIHKHYPKSIHQQLDSDGEFRRVKILNFIKDLVEIIYFNKPMFDFNIFLIRNNFNNDANTRFNFSENNEAAILVDQEDEIEDWNLLLEGKKTKNNKQFVVRWFSISNSLKEKDALIISSYKGNDIIKIGLLPKGTTYYELPQDNHYKVFKLSNTIEFDKRDNQIFNSLIPSQVTISPIKQRTSFIISKYAGVPLETTLDNLSPASVELICAEWLRSGFAPKNFQLKYQLLRTGGNFPNIDIYGVTKNGKELAGQVSVTSNKKTIENKVTQLSKTGDRIKIMFCDTNNEEDYGIPTVSIRKVFDDLSSNDYKLLLDKLVGQ